VDVHVIFASDGAASHPISARICLRSSRRSAKTKPSMRFAPSPRLPRWSS
jgi:hypothetical protein